jgi:hypothetical protein
VHDVIAAFFGDHQAAFDHLPHASLPRGLAPLSRHSRTSQSFTSVIPRPSRVDDLARTVGLAASEPRRRWPRSPTHGDHQGGTDTSASKDGPVLAAGLRRRRYRVGLTNDSAPRRRPPGDRGVAASRPRLPRLR